jgi:hypothetical protein
LAADRPRFREVGAEFAGLVVKPPERGADRHRRKLAAGILVRPRHPGEPAIFLGQARVEHAPKVDVTGRAAGADDDGLVRTDREIVAIVAHRNAQHPAIIRHLAVDPAHAVLEQDLDPGAARRDFERPHQTVARGTRLLDARVGRLPGLHGRPIHHRAMHFARHRISHRIAAQRIRRLVDKDDAVCDQPLEGRRTVIREGANDLGETRRHLAPHNVGLRIAVQQEQRRPAAAGHQVYLGARGRDPARLKAGKEIGHHQSLRHGRA